MLTICRKSNITEPAAPEEPEFEPELLDEDALIEQRRKRREAIKAKYRGSAPPLLVQALQLGDKLGQNQSEDGDTPTRSSRSHTQLARPILTTFRRRIACCIDSRHSTGPWFANRLHDYR